MTTILDLISQFGPVIIFAGTFFEGEIFAIIAGFLAYRGSYSFEFMLALAFVGSMIGDLSVFLFARYFSSHRWVERWRRRENFARAIRLVERFQAFFVIVNRYIYGLRMPGLIALGLSRISILRFAILNVIGAAIWSSIFTTLGYVFGYSIQTVLDRLEVMEQGVGILLGVVAVAIAGFFAVRQWGPIVKRRWQARRDGFQPRHELGSERANRERGSFRSRRDPDDPS